MSTSPKITQDESDPLEFFLLPRKVRRCVEACTTSSENRPTGDVFYLWFQLGVAGEIPAIAPDKWLNVIDEAASVGVNWLVITLSAHERRSVDLDALCRWAQETYAMTVCLHTSEAMLEPSIEAMVTALDPDCTYVLVEPEHAQNFVHLREKGVQVSLATPPGSEKDVACDFPYKMVFVDPKGNLYTCGLVAGEEEFFLGSVFSGSLEQIVHNPKLPHSVLPSVSRGNQGCSGCPPLVAKHLCKH